jgi:hypothetical protein
VHILTDGIGGPLIPGGLTVRLLRGKNLNESVAVVVEVVATDMVMKTDRVELRNDIDLFQAAIDAVRKRNIDKAILPPIGTAGLARYFVSG